MKLKYFHKARYGNPSGIKNILIQNNMMAKANTHKEFFLVIFLNKGIHLTRLGKIKTIIPITKVSIESLAVRRKMSKLSILGIYLSMTFLYRVINNLITRIIKMINEKIK